MHFPADNLSAVQVKDEIEMKPAPQHLRRQIGHIPAPDLRWGSGDVRGGWPSLLRRLGAAAVGRLSMGFQHPAETGFAGDVNAFVSQHGHDTRRWNGSKSRLVRDPQHLRTLGLA